VFYAEGMTDLTKKHFNLVVGTLATKEDIDDLAGDVVKVDNRLDDMAKNITEIHDMLFKHSMLDRVNRLENIVREKLGIEP